MDAPPVQYVKTSDGYDIAYTTCGEGQLALLFPILFSSVETIWDHYHDLMVGLAERFHLVCFDARGEGMSTRGLTMDTTMESFDLDVEAVTSRIGREPAILFAFGSRGHHAIRYASSHPKGVRAIVWNGAALRNDAWPASLWVGLSNENWRLFLRGLVSRDIPRDQQRLWVKDFEVCINPGDWGVRSRVTRPSDVTAQVRSLNVPTLVTHSRDHLDLPVDESIKFVATAQRARLVMINGDSPVGAAAEILAAVDAFVTDLSPHGEQSSSSVGESLPRVDLTPRQIEVLRLIASGMTNRQIANELVLSVRTVERHLEDAYAKLGAHNRFEAIAISQSLLTDSEAG